MICDQSYSSEEVSVPLEQCLDKKAIDRGDLMFSTLGRALPIEIRVNLKARRPRLKAARAPFQLDKKTIFAGI